LTTVNHIRLTEYSRLKKFTFYWLPVILYCLLIYFQSANPSPKQIPQWPLIDKLLHFAAYGVMAILFYRAYRTLPIANTPRVLMLLSIVSASLYGISDEIHQSFVPFRDAEFMDVVADVLGSACGALVCRWWYRLKPAALLPVGVEKQKTDGWKAD